jgi:hypothetical protein
MREGQTVCRRCGAVRRAEDAYCSQCGAEPDDQADVVTAVLVPARRRRRWLPLLLLAAIVAAGVYAARNWGLDGPRLGPTEAATEEETPLQAGAVIGEATLGPAGGTIEAAGRVRIEFPAGALAAETPIIVCDSPASSPERPFYFVQTKDRRRLFLKKPARVTLPLPAGGDSGDSRDWAAIHEVGPGMGLTVPVAFDEATHSASFEVEHFSWVSLAKIQKTALGTGGTFLVLFVTAAVGPGTSGLWIPITAVSMIVGDVVVAPAVQKLCAEYSLDGQLTVGGFELHWANSGAHATHIPLGDEYLFGPEPVSFLFDRQGRLAKVVPRLIEDCEREFPDYTCREIPREIWILAWELRLTRRYYLEAGYNPPEAMPVVIHAALGTDATGAKNYGEWDDGPIGHLGYLHLLADYVSAEKGERSRKRRETICHEYWHAVWSHNHYDCRFPWANECLATVFESEVFPECDSFLKSRQWNSVSLTLGNGFFTAGGEDEERRGYYLWPWGKSLLHRGGHEQVRRFINNELTGESLADEFTRFAERLTRADQLLPPTVPQTPAVYPHRQTGTPLAVPTGWEKFDHIPLFPPQAIGLGAARDVPQASLPRPMSFQLLKLLPGPPPPIPSSRELPPLIIRRLEPDEDELYLALAPSARGVVPDRELVRGQKSLVVPPEPLKSLHAQTGPPLPLAVVNLAESQRTTSVGREANALLVYYLQPPAKIRAELRPAADNGPPRVRFQWAKPEFGRQLKAADCLNGYRVAVRRLSDGKTAVLDEPLLNPNGETQEVELPPDVEVLGLVSEDSGTRDAAGRLLRSPVGLIDDDGDIMALLLPADSLPAGLKEERREDISELNGPLAIAAALQVLATPADPAKQEVPDLNFNPLLPPMNFESGAQEEEWKKKAYKDYVRDKNGIPLYPKTELGPRASPVQIDVRIARPKTSLVMKEAMLRFGLEFLAGDRKELKPAGKDTLRTGADSSTFGLVYRCEDVLVGLFAADNREETQATAKDLQTRLDAHIRQVLRTPRR